VPPGEAGLDQLTEKERQAHATAVSAFAEHGVSASPLTEKIPVDN